MPAKKTPQKEKPQKQRFIEAAKRAGVDETGAEFDRALGQLVPSRRTPKNGKKPPK